MDRANVRSAVFTQSPIGAVGLTEAEARRRYGEVDIYSAHFKPMKNTLSGRRGARLRHPGTRWVPAALAAPSTLAASWLRPQAARRQKRQITPGQRSCRR